MNADAGAVVAPFLIARVGGISAYAPDVVILRRSAARVTPAASARERQRRTAAPLIAVLHDLVPSLPDRRLRGAALALKRALHNGRPARVSSADADALSARMTPEGRDRFAAWRRATDEVRSLLAEAEATTTTELAAVAAGLADACTAPAMLRAISLASPALARELGAGAVAARLTPGGRLSRSCVGYLIRAAVKPSPFSTFTTIGAATFGPSGSVAAAPGSGSTRVAVSRALATELLLALATNPVLGPAFGYRVHDGMTWIDGRPTVLAGRGYCQDGFFWRSEQVLHADAYRPLLDRLRSLGRSVLTYGELLAGVGGDTAVTTVGRLLELGLVRPVAPWDGAGDATLPAVAAAVRHLGTPVAAEIARALTELDGEARAVATATPAVRAATVRRLPVTARAAFDTAGRIPPPWIDTAPLVHEDVATEVSVPRLGAEVAADLVRFAERVRPQIFRTHVYADLVDHFVARYGSGGVCRDLPDYLYSFALRPDAATLLAIGAQRDRRWRPPDGPTGTRSPSPRTAAPPGLDGRAAGGPDPAATVLFQVDAASAAALARGDFQLVVNQVQAGIGGMVARFLPLLADHSTLPTDLRRWVRAGCGEARPVEIPVVSNLHGLQRPTGLFERLRWPGEAPAADDTLEIGDLALVHEPCSSVLTLLDRDGRRLAPVYLGAVPPHLAPGPLRLLLTLADPWVVPAAAGSHPRRFERSERVPTTVEHEARVTDGRLVIRRGHWRLPAHEFPAPSATESVFTSLVRAHEWRSRWGIPEEVFATIECGHSPVVRAGRKPMWLNFASGHSLAQIGGLMRSDAVVVDLVEALPDRRRSGLFDAAGQPRVCEYISLLRWIAGSR